MKLLRLGLFSPSEPSLETKLNLLGVKAMLDQEGVFYHEIPADESSDRIVASTDVLIAMDHGRLSDSEEQKLLDVASRIPLIWIGLPRASAGMANLLGLDSVKIDQTKGLRQLRVRPHQVSRGLSWPEEKKFRLKKIEHLVTKGLTRLPSIQEIAGIYLLDGLKFGSAIYAIPGILKRVVFGFPLGKFFALQTSTHWDPRTDLDILDYPLHTTIDSLRRLLLNAIIWASPDTILLRRYYWQPMDGSLPRGYFCLNHDLCGFSEEGRRFIVEICRKEGIKTTFFDFSPFRLTKESAEGHDVALHISDSAVKEEILQQKQELERIQGNKIFGWRRHGSTDKSNFPRIWRDMADCGFKWSTALAVQTNPWMILSEATATACRLPYKIIDTERGELLEIVEMPTFDSQDAERLSNFSYGGRLNWLTYEKYVTKRFDFAGRHNLLTGFLIHGWTAGVKIEEGVTYGAIDCQRMMKLVIRLAKERKFAITTHQELCDWWNFRSKVECSFSEDIANLRLSGIGHCIALEIMSGMDQRQSIRLNNKEVQPVIWPDTPERSFIIVDPRDVGEKTTLTIG